ncbi:MAG TPA: cytidine deaminase [Firmicutes bacterium]|nr:cytidine deaminase [Bacillota bacterium]
MDFEKIYQAAKAVVAPRVLSPFAEAGGVGAALLTAAGNLYTGVCIDTACSMGFCAEHAAAAAMITAGENQITALVAVGGDGQVLAPCGRCREFLTQLHPKNRDAQVLLPGGKILRLKELLPWDWKQ